MNGQTKYADLLRSWEAVQAAFKGIGAQACQGSIKAEPSDTAYAVLTYSEMLERIGHIKAELGDMTAEHMDDLCAELKHLETSMVAANKEASQKSKRMKYIYRSVMSAMQEAEEMEGCEGADYARIMCDIASECKCRLETALKNGNIKDTDLPKHTAYAMTGLVPEVKDHCLAISDRYGSQVKVYGHLTYNECYSKLSFRVGSTGIQSGDGNHCETPSKIYDIVKFTDV